MGEALVRQDSDVKLLGSPKSNVYASSVWQAWVLACHLFRKGLPTLVQIIGGAILPQGYEGARIFERSAS